MVIREKERDDSRSLFLRGPDGLIVELVYRPDPDHHARHDTTPPAPIPEDDDEPGPPAPKPARRRGSR